MTKEDIIAMAREAGFADGVAEIVGLAGFANFANLVAAYEREACAKICQQQSELQLDERVMRGIDACTDAIRARGQA